MSEVWSVPGYDVQALIGFGATGEVWRARELATGEAVALKRLRPGADPAAIASLRREASVLRSLDTPYVVRLRAVHGEGADTVLVLDLAAGGSLAALLTRRGSLDPGEVVTIAAPLAQALATAHGCGLVHGDVTPSNVLFTADGMPLLADLGLARFAGGDEGDGVDGTAEYVDPAVAAGGQPDEAADVWALAAVCHHLLSGTPPHDGDTAEGVLDAARSGSRAPLGLLAPTAPRALVAAIERGLEADPALRPDAASFASALRRAHAAAPVRLVNVPAGIERLTESELRPTHRIREADPPLPTAAPAPDRRRLVAIAAAVAALLLAAGVGWLSGRSGPVRLASVEAATRVTASPVASPARPPVSSPAAATATAPIRWLAVLDGLDRARAEAFATGDSAGLAKVYTSGSALLAADRRMIGQLVVSRQRARGLRHVIRAVDVTSYDGQVAVLRTTDELAAFDLVDLSGGVLEHSPPRPAASFVVLLAKTPAGWRLATITASPAA